MNKVLFVASDLSYGGAEKMLCFVAESLAKRGMKVAIANMQEVHDNSRQISDEITVYRLESSEKRFIEKIEKFRELQKCVRDYRPDIIISFKTVQNTLASLVGKVMNIPVIISERGDPTKENLRRLRTRLHWLAINAADGAVFQTTGAQAYFEPRLIQKSIVIPNPVEVSEKTQKSDYEEKAVVSFGRLENYQKRYDIMLEAFRLFSIKQPDYVLKLYGTGPDEAQIRKWCKELNLDDKVKFMGYSGKPGSMLCRGNIFLITSDFEGISNALLEAMAAGYPVVSTDSSPGGARMVITDRENGRLVPVQNPALIAEALTEFATNKAMYENCAHNAVKVVDRFSQTRIADEWYQYVQEVLTRKKKGK